MREKLLDTRPGHTVHFAIFDSLGRTTDAYIQTGEYDDGRLGEVFIKVSKQADSMNPTLDAVMMFASIALQHGASVDELFSKLVGVRGEPAGAVSGVVDIPRCTSPLDLVARWILKKYGNVEVSL